MKVNKKILLLLPLLVVVFLLLWYAFQPAASTAEFLHNSVEYSKTSLYEVESIMLEEGKPSRNTVTEPQLIDFDMKQPMDPAAVSYTHLDVYKRQGALRGWEKRWYPDCSI